VGKKKRGRRIVVDQCSETGKYPRRKSLQAGESNHRERYQPPVGLCCGSEEGLREESEKCREANQGGTRSPGSESDRQRRDAKRERSSQSKPMERER